MPTKNQNLKKKIINLKKKNLLNSPQKKGTCLKVFITTPKKPNSAARKTVKVILLSKKKISYMSRSRCKTYVTKILYSFD